MLTEKDFYDYFAEETISIGFVSTQKPEEPIVFSKQARKDTDELTQKQKVKLQEILTNIIAINPYIGKSLKCDLEGLYSYRLNRKDRLLYEIYEDDKTILIIRTKTHYGD
ncbi:type II toxin-antitoxin system RelE family toxin [Microcystis ichthyoblabe FBCC-A1114]|uniref:type II toxin-antitoxin system RelE family toxin n=1 Tax=Microcystis TaxID=1125 RepID=UPI003D2C9F4D